MGEGYIAIAIIALLSSAVVLAWSAFGPRPKARRIWATVTFFSLLTAIAVGMAYQASMPVWLSNIIFVLLAALLLAGFAWPALFRPNKALNATGHKAGPRVS